MAELTSLRAAAGVAKQRAEMLDAEARRKEVGNLHFLLLALLLHLKLSPLTCRSRLRTLWRRSAPRCRNSRCGQPCLQCVPNIRQGRAEAADAELRLLRLQQVREACPALHWQHSGPAGSHCSGSGGPRPGCRAG
jgi:hypothetical protein